MKKCILMPDSFKGTMSANQVIDIMFSSVKRTFPNCDIITIPMSDGGEGTVDCFLKALRKGEKIHVRTKGPYMEDIDSFFGIIDDIGIIEIAASAGVDLVIGKMDPIKTTTYGVGELINEAIKRGCKTIILGLGGSCTNDGGAGMAVALGTRFYNKEGGEFLPVGGTLADIKRIDVTETKKRLEGIEIIAICDIDNPLYGENGAAYVFAPQKGADSEKVRVLDYQLKKFDKIIKDILGLEVNKIQGAGAAGGMGAGAYAFLDAKLESGINVILDMIDFENVAQNCDIIFTGEGKLDFQSIGGKVVIGIGRRAKLLNIPVIAVVGLFVGSMSEVRKEGVSYVFETGPNRKGLEEIKKHCEEDLRRTMRCICNHCMKLILENNS